MMEFSKDEWSKLLNYIQKQLQDGLCEHCEPTDYGKKAMTHTPSGLNMCEGRFCESTLNNYIDDLSDEEIEQYFIDMINEKIF